MSELKVNKISPQSGTAFTLGDSGDTFTVPSGATLTVSGTLTQTGAQTFDGGVEIDNFTINGSEIDLSSGDMTLDVAGDIILDADGGEVLFHDATTAMGHISMDSSNITLKSLVSDKDIIFQGNDGGAGITALTLDMSAAGAATFNNAITSGAVITSGAGLVIADTGNIGSASDTDAIAIAANGVVTFSQGITSTAASNTFGASSFNDANITNVGTIAADRILGDGDTDSYVDFPGSDVVTINTGDNIRFRIDSSGILSTGGETAPDTTKGGISLNQAQFDDFILTLKSSDVAHSVTGEAEADTYLRMSKYSGTQGGAAIVAYGEGGEGVYLQGIIGSNQGSTAKSTSAGAPIIIKGTKESSNAAGAMASNENCAVILNHTNTRFIFDAEGDFHADASSTTFDAYDDAQLVRAYDLSHGKGVIDSKFDKFVAYNHEKLAELKLVGREENGTPNHFMNVTGMQRLHNGAIWQQYEKHNQLLDAVYELAKESIGEEKANLILEKHEIKRLN
tara:strand:- start:2148 stop:3674 length:1527 start_codon:yes stop_codon:yes gene_type:complete